MSELCERCSERPPLRGGVADLGQADQLVAALLVGPALAVRVAQRVLLGASDVAVGSCFAALLAAKDHVFGPK